MSLQDYKISEDTVQQIYVQAQQDILTGTAQKNKAVFDALPLLIKDRLNAVLDALSGSDAAAQVSIQTVDGLTAGNVQQAIEQIKALFDEYEAKIQSSAGAAAVGVSAIDGVSGSTVQQALQSIKGLIDSIEAGVLLPGSVTAEMIQSGVIVELGALLAVAAAAAYDPEGSYAVGDYCTHGGKLQKCGTAIPDGEAWNAEHWTETSVAEELKRKADVQLLQEYILPLSDGFSGTAKYSKDQFGIVRVYVAAVKDSGTITNNEVLCALPEGFRPKLSFAVVGYGNSNPNTISDRHPVNMYISTNGDIAASFLSETDATKIASLYGTSEFLS